MVNTEEHIDIIEKALNIQIFISGDVIRTPKINSKTFIKLLLQNSHFKVQPTEKAKVAGVSYKERAPLTYFSKDICCNFVIIVFIEIIVT